MSTSIGFVLGKWVMRLSEPWWRFTAGVALTNECACELMCFRVLKVNLGVKMGEFNIGFALAGAVCLHRELC